jgi:hypothetical protein
MTPTDHVLEELPKRTPGRFGLQAITGFSAVKPSNDSDEGDFITICQGICDDSKTR